MYNFTLKCVIIWLKACCKCPYLPWREELLGLWFLFYPSIYDENDDGWLDESFSNDNCHTNIHNFDTISVWIWTKCCHLTPGTTPILSANNRDRRLSDICIVEHNWKQLNFKIYQHANLMLLRGGQLRRNYPHLKAYCLLGLKACARVSCYQHVKAVSWITDPHRRHILTSYNPCFWRRAAFHISYNPIM